MNDNHYAKGAPDGKGGEFAPKDSSTESVTKESGSKETKLSLDDKRFSFFTKKSEAKPKVESKLPSFFTKKGEDVKRDEGKGSSVIRQLSSQHKMFAGIESLKNYFNHRAERIANIKTSFSPSDIQKISTEFSRITKTAEVYSRVPWECLFGMLGIELPGGRKGIDHLANQFETQSSGGAFSPSTRYDLSKKMFGTSSGISSDAKNNIEKYGRLSGQDIEAFCKSYSGSWYGGSDGYILKFKPDVKNRVTYTIGDSLDYDGWGDESYLPQSLLRRFDIGCISPRRRTDYSSDSYKLISGMQNIKNGDVEGLARIFDKNLGLSSSDGYIETQLHGEYKSDTISEIIMEDNHLRGERQKNGFNRIVLAAQSKGINVYKYHNYEDKIYRCVPFDSGVGIREIPQKKTVNPDGSVIYEDEEI